MKLLAGKPYYFLTDRDTLYTHLVHNNTKYHYYPDEFETLSPKGIEAAKRKIVRSFLFWGIRNKQSMASQDYSIVFSRWFDGMGLILFGVFGGLITRKLLFKIQTPFVESMLSGSFFNLNLIKNSIALAVPFPLIYSRYKATLNQIYLYDLALQYQHKYDNSLKDSHLQSKLEQIFNERFKEPKPQK